MTSITARETVALVAQLPAAVEASALNVRVSVDGQVVSNSGFNASGESNLWGWTAGPLYLPGAWKFELTDVGGNVLASGSLTVTE